MKFVFTYIFLAWWEIIFRSNSVRKAVLKRCSAPLLKERLWHRCFPVNFAKFLKILFVQNTSGRLLLWTTASKTSNTKYLELIKRRSKVQEKNMSCERALNFDQWKTFSKNYKPMIVWLWLVYKFTENCQIYRLFSEFIQTKKRYPTSLDKIHIQNTYQNTYQLGNYLSYQVKIFLMNLTPKELTCCKISNICHCAFKPHSHDIFFS